MSIILNAETGSFDIYKVKADLLSGSVSDDKTREMICFPYLDMENKSLVATDGRRMAVLSLDEYDIEKLSGSGFSSCFLHIVKVTKDVYKCLPAGDHGIFPNWQRVIELAGDPAVLLENFGFCGKNPQDSKIISQLILLSGEGFNIDYLKPLKSILIASVKKDKGKAFIFTFSFGKYLVMPFVE